MSEHHLIITVLLLLLAGIAVAVIQCRQPLTSVVLYSMFSLLMALAYLALKAPDVAITEAAVGAGVSTVIFLLALVFTSREHRPSRPFVRYRLLPLIAVTLLGAGLFYATLFMPAFGDATGPAHTHVSRYYLEHTPTDMAIPNTVTAILASYRGYDTLGEVCVVFTAMLAVLLLLKRGKTHA